MDYRSEMTTKELRHWAMYGGNIPSAEIVALCDRLAAYERNTIKRDESVPDWAFAWRKDDRGPRWIGEARSLGFERICNPNPRAPAYAPAPDLRPDTEGPITLPIVDADTP